MAKKRGAGWSREAVRKSLETRGALAQERAEALRPIVEQAISRGHRSTRQIAAYLNERGIPTARNRAWRASQVCRLLARLDESRDRTRMADRASANVNTASYPSWPAMMQRSLAALYCGLSTAEFDREVAAGRLPPPHRLGDSELWRREEVDRQLAELNC